ncbi:MAG: helix-turn-helix domain-containing protein [Patescibacteria group bacterium]
MTVYELQQLLENTGLQEKEAAIYIASLELGPSLVSTLSRRAKINRSTAYSILEKLTKEGLMSKYVRSGTRFYTAEDPSRIMKYLERKKLEIELKFEDLKDKIYEFKRVQVKICPLPKVEMLEGSQGIKNIYEKLRDLEKKPLVISPAKAKSPSEIIICEDRVIFISQGENFGAVVVSLEISGMLRKIFDALPESMKSKR